MFGEFETIKVLKWVQSRVCSACSIMWSSSSMRESKEARGLKTLMS